MAEEVEMTPVTNAEPPAAAPVAAVPPKPATMTLKPMIRKPGTGGTAVLKPGLKLPPKPGATLSTAGLKLPPKPGATLSTSGLKLPPKPMIRKPGSTVVAAPLPKPVLPKPVVPKAAEEPKAAAPQPVAAPAPAEVNPESVAELKPVAAEVKPEPAVAELKPAAAEVKLEPVAELNPVAPAAPAPKPLEALKTITHSLKGITQEIPQQAILRKTGIIAEGAMSEAQKEAAKHKTARISLSDAMGVAPVKNENAPMKTIRIKRPIEIPGATKPLAPQPKAEVPASQAETKLAEPSEAATASTASITQRKTLKIARPGGAVRPSGKFGIKRPQPTAATPAPTESAGAELADIPEMPTVATLPELPAATASDGPAWLWAISALVQVAACLAIGALAWFLYQNTQIAYF